MVSLSSDESPAMGTGFFAPFSEKGDNSVAVRYLLRINTGNCNSPEITWCDDGIEDVV